MDWFAGIWWQHALLGLTGGALVDGIEIWKVVRANGGGWPRRFRRGGYIAAECIRLFAGAALAMVFGISGQVHGPLGALAIGVTAPLIIEKMLNPDPLPPPLRNRRQRGGNNRKQVKGPQNPPAAGPAPGNKVAVEKSQDDVQGGASPSGQGAKAP